MSTGGSRWAFLTDHWRLKLTAGVLAVILFGTVAFAQNPITVRTLHVRISSYQITDQNLILIKYPTHVDVQVVGLADAVDALSADDVAAAMDLSKVAAPGGQPQTIQVAVNVRTVAPGVTLQQSSIHVFVTIDSITTASIPLEVRYQPAATIVVDRIVTDAQGTTSPVSTVTVTGPASLLDGLKAYVDLKTIRGQGEFPGEAVKFQDKTGRTIGWPPPTIPVGSADVSNVDVSVTAHTPRQQEQVSLSPVVTGTPACGYWYTAINISPSFVTLTGDVASLGAAGGSISLGPVDVTGAVRDVRVSQKLSAPTGTTVSPGSVTITVTIRQVFNCTPASPAPPPTPQPTPA